MRIRKLSILLAISLVALAFAVYWAGLQGSFFFDDGASILVAPGVRLTTISVESLSQAWFSGGAGPLGRPIAQLTFAVNHYFTGFNPFAFKATNFAIHLVCGALVFKLTRQLLETKESATMAIPEQKLIAPGVVAALWLLHPIQLLPVLHVVQRMTSLSALFLVAGLILHIEARTRTNRVGSVWLLAGAWGLLWPLSVLSKETGLLFPWFVLLWELICHRRSAERLDAFTRLFSAVVALSTIAVVAYLLSPNARWIWLGYGMRPFTLVERVLTEGRVIWFYLGLIVAPQLSAFGLHHDDIVISKDLLTPLTTGVAMLGIVAIVSGAFLVRRRAPLISFGIAWFLTGHMMESTVLPLEIAHEHRNYLPLFGVLVASMGLVKCIKGPFGLQSSVGIGVAGLAMLYFPFITTLRAHQFGNEIRRAQMEVQNHPYSPIAQHEAGLILASLPDARDPHSSTYFFARSHFERATSIDPNFKIGLLGLIDLDCNAGLTVSESEIGELSRRLGETAFAPGDRNVLYMLKEMSIAGKFCLSRSDMDRLFSAAIGNSSVSPSVRVFLSSWHADYLWLHAHDLNAARIALKLSLDIGPLNQSNRLKWAQLLLLSGERAEAAKKLIELKDLSFSSEERVTLNELLATVNVPSP